MSRPDRYFIGVDGGMKSIAFGTKRVPYKAYSRAYCALKQISQEASHA